MGISEPKMKPAVFLDRDGVINKAIVQDGKPYPPSNLTELEILPDAVKACSMLQSAGFLLIVVTNQPDVARGVQSRQIVETINAELCAKVPIDDIRVCYHDDRDECFCRKPKPGLILQAAQDWKIDLANSFVVGDRWRDIEAGKQAGCTTIFVNRGYTEVLRSAPDYSVSSLLEASELILNHPKVSRRREIL